MKNLKRFAALVMTGAMVASIFSFSAFAEDTKATAIKTTTFNKSVTTDGNTYMPATTFTFTVDNGAAIADYNGQPVYEGVTGGVSVNSIAYQALDGLTSGTTKQGTLTYDASKFTKPGIYHYTLTEVNGGYEGINYDTTARDLYVYVQNAATAGTYEVYAGELALNGAKNDTFTNNYGNGDNDSTHDLTVTKSVTGAQGDANKEFNFTVTVNGAAGENYKFAVNGTVVAPLVSGTQASFTLKSGQSAQIYGLSATDKYTITETDANSDGYTTTFDKSSGFVTADNTAITCVNDKQAATPTGIALSVAPYVLMVVLAGAFAFLFLRKRNNAR